MMRIGKKVLSVLLAIVLCLPLFPNQVQASQTNGITAGFIKGVDISCITALEKSGVKYYDSNHKNRDIFDILKDKGINYVRIRIWNNPYDTSTGKSYGAGNCDLNNAIAIGKRATAHGMKVYIDFQYSDFWADPAKQYAPKAWKDYSTDQKAQAIYQFTYDSLKALLNAGVSVGMVQIGNETNGSMCGMGGLYDGKWDLSTGVGAAMKKGCQAVTDINSAYKLTGSKAVLRVLHFTDPVTNASWYAQQVANQGIEYDVFAVSAYSFWFGKADDLATVLQTIAKTYNKKVMVAETSSPYTYENGDATANNITAQKDITYQNYDVSVAGQKQAIKDIFQAVASVNLQSQTSGYGLGGFYWEPDWIGVNEKTSDQYGTGWASSVSENYERLFSQTASQYATTPQGSSWDNMALFDKNGVALDSLNAFTELQ